MNSMEFARLVKMIDALSARQVEDLQSVLANLGLRIEALRQVESRVETAPGCARCGCGRSVRWGRARTGFQRWRCCSCGATRSSTTGTAVAGVRRPLALHALIKEMFSGQKTTCRAAAARLRVNKTTIWRWRRLILGTLLDADAARLLGIIEADETFQRESRKGSREWVRHRQDSVRNPKPPRPRWRDFGPNGPKMQRGLSKWQIPILTALDRSGRRRAAVIPDRRAATIIRAMHGHIERDAVLCSDAAPAYRKLAAAHGLEHKILGSKPGQRIVERVFHIQNINALHARYKEFIKPFRGPATKYLPLYLAWFLASLPDTRNTAPRAVWDKLAA